MRRNMQRLVAMLVEVLRFWGFEGATLCRLARDGFCVQTVTTPAIRSIPVCRPSALHNLLQAGMRPDFVTTQMPAIRYLPMRDSLQCSNV